MASAGESALAGLLLGTAVGDSLGLPREGLSGARALRMYGPTLEHRLVLGRGMLSDDTEHTALVAQAYLAAGGDVERFRASLAWRLRGWLLGLPAGVGLGTARALVKLWIGFPPTRSGVFSAGNGPAMRAGVLGLLTHDAELTRWIAAATEITHTDPRACRAAQLVAIACRMGAHHAPGAVSAPDFVEEAHRGLPEVDDELAGLLQQLAEHAARGASVAEFAHAIGAEHGVSGYAYRTVPVALYAWLRHPRDFRAALTAAVALGGDADTVGAITGAICGASVGEGGIPAAWIAGIAEYPRSIEWFRRLAQKLADGTTGPLPLFWPALLPRNAVFLAIVLAHGFRRLFPPYRAVA